MAAVSEELAISADRHPWRRLARAGEGTSSVVWRAEHSVSGRTVALKVAKPGVENAGAIAREAALLARVARRWGPELVDAGPGYLAIGWVEGLPLAPIQIVEKDREALAAEIAHAVG